MEESILRTILNMLGPYDDYEPFSQDVKLHVNTYLGVLSQLGVGKKDFRITGPDETWGDFLEGFRSDLLDMVKDYIYLRVKLVFDSTSMPSSLIALYQEEAKELGWRLNTRVEDESV